MVKLNANQIIDSIAKVTTHAERELLEASLMSTLFELLSLKRISLYKVIYEYGEKECLLTSTITDSGIEFHDPCAPNSIMPLDKIPGLSIAMERHKPVFIKSDKAEHHSETYIYPITNRAGEVTCAFIITADELQESANEPLINGYFQIYRNYACLMDDSEHDILTGLLNRRTFERDLERILNEWQASDDQFNRNGEFSQKRRKKQKSAKNWLAVIDIDFFKRINDQYGHLYGDEVLLLMANIMRQSFRGYDKLFRFGGEEFVVILRATSEHGATKALERLRSKVQNYPFPQIDQVTVSIGYVEIADQGIPSAVIGHADDALYYAKGHGRNQVCSYHALLASGELTESQPFGSSDIELF